jgi:hypothetical protein
MSLISIYSGNPTAGETNGTLVSSGTGTQPINPGAIVVPESGFEESEWVKCAIRCDSGFETEAQNGDHAELSIIDSSAVTLWQLAPDDNDSAGTPEDWGDPLVFDTQVTAVNTIFWVRARVADDETPVNDTSVQVRVEALIGAAS